ncbi:MAG TPA: hypothetical protein VGQ83_01895 [Polyangia bacterium]|jgi:hypothetical protein
MKRLLLAAALLIGACGGSSTGRDAAPAGTDAAVADDAGPAATDGAAGDAAALAFGAACTDPAQCASNVCFTFGDGSRLCTLQCTAPDQCPAGSQGQKCNGQGYCRP